MKNVIKKKIKNVNNSQINIIYKKLKKIKA